MIRLRDLIERARRKPVLGLIVVVLLIGLVVLVALHPAVDALEVAATCLTMLSIAVSMALVLIPSTPGGSGVPLLLSRARPPTARMFTAPPQLLAPLRL